MPLTSTTFWRVLMAFSRTGSTDCMIPSLLSISLIYGCLRWPSSFWRPQRVVVHHRVYEDSSGKGFLDVLDGGGLGNGGISITSGLGIESGGEGVGKLGEEVIFNLGISVKSVGSDGGDEGDGEFHL